MTSIWREVGDRVWVRRYESLDQTIGVIGGDTGLVVIDTRSSHRLADELRADLEQLPGSLAAVVNTHGHWDHAFGNARFLPAPIWGHVRCAAMIVERGDEMRIRAKRSYPSEAIGEVELTPPTELFEESATLDLGDRQVELRYLGRGHTDNDIVVVVPDASVLFAGDLLEDAPAPGFGDSYPIDWVAAGKHSSTWSPESWSRGMATRSTSRSPSARSPTWPCSPSLRRRSLAAPSAPTRPSGVHRSRPRTRVWRWNAPGSN